MAASLQRCQMTIEETRDCQMKRLGRWHIGVHWQVHWKAFLLERGSVDIFIWTGLIGAWERGHLYLDWIF
jgi:hypothetical protein